VLDGAAGERDAYGFLEHAADPISSSVPVRIGELIDEVVGDLMQATAADANRPRVELDVTQEAHDAVIWCRRGLLGWSFRKVIDNSCTYAGDVPQIRVALSLDGGSIRVEVSDNGPGMSAAQAEELFRWERPRIQAHGSGIALPIVGSVIAALGGVVRAEPGVPRGLRTVFYLPRERDDGG
jgi:K+-sensing histidine kinase KdpD